MKRKLLACLMAMTLCTFSLSAVPVFANEIVDSTASSADDESAGIDETQGVSTNYEDLDSITTTTYSKTESTTVYATKAGYVKVTIPRALVLGKTQDETGDEIYEGSFNVRVTADIAGSQTVRITPKVATTFSEINNKNSATTATVLLNGAAYCDLEANDLLNEQEVILPGLLRVNNITAGSWRGEITFDIKLLNE